jgi:hypothetical protein
MVEKKKTMEQTILSMEQTILQHLPITSGTSSSSGHFGCTSSFKVQVNFNIPVFEGQIDA